MIPSPRQEAAESETDMSAYIVPPETIHVLAAWASVGHSPFGTRMTNDSKAREFAEILFKENARSVAHRYREEPAAITPEYIKANWCAIVKQYKPELCLAAARGYEYQACECGDYLETSAACIVSRAIKNAGAALCDLAGIENWTVGLEQMKAAKR